MKTRSECEHNERAIWKVFLSQPVLTCDATEKNIWTQFVFNFSKIRSIYLFMSSLLPHQLGIFYLHFTHFLWFVFQIDVTSLFITLYLFTVSITVGRPNSGTTCEHIRFIYIYIYIVYLVYKVWLHNPQFLFIK